LYIKKYRWIRIISSKIKHKKNLSKKVCKTHDIDHEIDINS
jgi:hypothetical protein